MTEQNIPLPSKPKIITEENNKGVYEIDGLYPGYGHTLGNSLRRIILSSITGASITGIKIKGVDHEFSTIEGVKEDVISMILNLKKVRLNLTTDEPQVITLKVKGQKEVYAKDIEAQSQVEILTPDAYLFTVSDKATEVDMEITVERGLGYVPKENVHKDRVDVGTISLDASFTPIKRVMYETENMRVGDRTDYNRLRIFIETDGTLTPKEALERSIEIMIAQLKAIVGFKEEVIPEPTPTAEEVMESDGNNEEMADFLKTRIESLDLSARTISSLSNANIRTVGGLARKSEEDILDIEGLGTKGLQEIKKILGENGIELK